MRHSAITLRLATASPVRFDLKTFKSAVIELRSCFLFSLSLLACGLLAEETSVYRVPVPQDVIDDYQLLVGGRGAINLKHYSGKGARRDVVELVLVQQALALANSEFVIEFVPMRSYQAILEDVAFGKFIMAGSSVWRADALSIPDGFWVSEPVIRQGQFEAGFYTSSTNDQALGVKSLEELQRLKAVTNRHWRPDWDTLEGLGLTKTRDVRSWESIVRLLASHRADITLASFNAEPGMRIEMDGCVLVPIPNLKTSLIGERVFVVSRAHPKGQAIFDALQRGLRELEAAGTIERAYRECGFINPRVQDWKVLLPESF